MLNITKLAERLKEETEWQETPFPLTDGNYEHMVIDGLERLFVDTGRAMQYDEELYERIIVSEEESYLVYNADFPLDERRYILICSQMNFFAKVQSDVNNAFGYSTDALTVTNADKPYANLKDTLDKLDNERRIIYYKMVRYTLGIN